VYYSMPFTVAQLEMAQAGLFAAMDESLYA
jgi:hypothetical protein